MAIEINAKTTALLIQDLQNDVITEGGAFADSGSPAHAKSQNVVANVIDLAAAGRRAGMAIIHVHYVVDAGAPGLKLNAPLFQGVKEANAVVRGTWGAAPVDGLEQQEGDFLVEKIRMNGFHDTQLESILKGEVAQALDFLSDDYANGADPIVLVQDLLEVVHWLSRVKVTPDIADGPTIAEADKVRGKDLAGRLSMGSLTRAWQMLLKGLREAQSAPSPIKAVEMIVIRLAYLADLPTPADAVKTMSESAGAGGGGGASQPSSTGAVPSGSPTGVVGNGPGGSAPALAVEQAAPSPMQSSEPVAQLKADPQSFEEVIALTDELNERILKANLVSNVHLVRFDPVTPSNPGSILYRPGKNAPGDLAQQLSRFLNEHTGQRWVVTVSLDEQGGDTVHEQEEEAKRLKRDEIAAHPFMQSVLETFPGAKIEEIRDIGGYDQSAASEKTDQTNGDYEE